MSSEYFKRLITNDGVSPGVDVDTTINIQEVLYVQGMAAAKVSGYHIYRKDMSPYEGKNDHEAIKVFNTNNQTAQEKSVMQNWRVWSDKADCAVEKKAAKDAAEKKKKEEAKIRMQHQSSQLDPREHTQRDLSVNQWSLRMIISISKEKSSRQKLSSSRTSCLSKSSDKKVRMPSERSRIKRKRS